MKYINFFFIIGFFGIPIAAPALCDKPMTGPITPETLAHHLEKTHAKSIDDIPACLPREFHENFTLIHHSAALFPECSDTSHPRVVLFSKDASTVIAIPGDLPNKTCNQIEILNFEAGRIRAGTLTHSGSWRVNLAPVSCVRCHGEDFHYIWDGYPYWPGVYGEDDDQIYPGSTTEKIYREFLRRKNLSRRYELTSIPDAPLAPYSPLFKYQVAFRPNLRLTSKLVLLNSLRIFRKIKESTQYEKEKYQALSLLADCATAPANLTVELWQKISAAEERERNEKECKLTKAILEHKGYGEDVQDSFDRQIKQQYFASKNTMIILEEIATMLGIQTTDWFMASNEIKHKNYGTIDLDGRLRHQLMMAFARDLDTKDHALTKELMDSATCNSPDLNNATIYRSLGFDCHAPKDPEKFCSLITAIGHGAAD